MKILTPIGSKERFLEMFQGVTKTQINEVATNVVQTGTQLVEKAFEELKNKQANVKQTNTQTVGDDNFVEIITNDNEGNEITFKFKVNSSEGDQDGVFNMNNAKLSEFKIKSGTLNVDMPENMQAVQDFNANHGDEIMNVVSEFANFETNTATVDDELYEDAIKLIDKVPYNKGTEQMQTNAAYADQKPTNPALRVKSDELDKFVSEMQEYEPEEDNGEEPEGDPEGDPFAYNPTLPKDDDDDDRSIKGVDPLDMTDTSDDTEQVSPEKAAIINQAYDNLVKSGNDAPTLPEIMREIDKLNGVKPQAKTRGIPKGAEAFWENQLPKSIVGDVDAEAIENNYFETLSPEKKKELINRAAQALTRVTGPFKQLMSQEEWTRVIKELAMMLYKKESYGLNEEAEKGEYPDQIGKKFKPKNQMPKKKKRPQAVVKLSEESEIPKEFWGNPEDELNEENQPEAGDFEKLAQDKEEQGEKLIGGKGDGKSPLEFSADQVRMGLEVEKEHTDDPLIAIEIVLDHLSEDSEYYTRKDDPEASAQDGAAKDSEEGGEEESNETDELLGFKPHNVSDYADEEKLVEDDSMQDYTGKVGDRFQDAENNQFTVKDMVKGGVTLQGQGGEKEIATNDIQFLKKLSETKEKKEIITEAQIKMARQALNKRGINEGMTKKEAIQILIKHNIK